MAKCELRMIKKLIKATFLDLKSAYTYSDPQKMNWDNPPYIRFPEYREKGDAMPIRVSEQEARAIFVYHCFKRKMYFSIEAPTKTKHNFSSFKIIYLPKAGRYLPKAGSYLPKADITLKDESGTDPVLQSAMFDLFIYGRNSVNITDWVVEFKAGTKGGRSGIETIYKDFEKMYASGENCLFVHTVEIKDQNEEDIEKETKKKLKEILKIYKTSYNVQQHKLSALFTRKGKAYNYGEEVFKDTGHTMTESEKSWVIALMVLVKKTPSKSKLYYYESILDRKRKNPFYKLTVDDMEIQ